MATVDPILLHQARQAPADQAVRVVLRFVPGDGVREATRALRALGFVATAATPLEVAGALPAGAVARLAAVPGLAAALPSAHGRPG
jgi:hypothetical protein